MPKNSITDLKNAIDSAPEMTAEHREELLALVESLEKEVATTAGSEDPVSTDHLRGAILVTEDVVRKRTAAEASEEDHDLGDRLAELEEKIELVAIEHPVIANVLAAIGRLV